MDSHPIFKTSKPTITGLLKKSSAGEGFCLDDLRQIDSDSLQKGDSWGNNLLDYSIINNNVENIKLCLREDVSIWTDSCLKKIFHYAKDKEFLIGAISACLVKSEIEIPSDIDGLTEYAENNPEKASNLGYSDAIKRLEEARASKNKFSP